MIDFIPLAVALIGTAICAYDDWKTSYLNEKLVYAMLGTGILWTIFFSSDITGVLISTAFVFAVGFIAYAFGQIGGGDVFLFTALNLLIPKYPDVLVPFMQSIGITPVTGAPYPFIVPVFLLAGLLGPMFFFSIRYLAKLLKIRDKIEDFRKKATTAAVYAFGAVVFIALWYNVSRGMALLFVPLLTSFLIMPFRNDIIKHFSMEMKKVEKINDDDVIALEFMKDATKKKLGLWRKTLTGPEIKKLKALARKFKIKEIPVCENLPQFVPFIFISLIVNLFIGDILVFMMLWGF